MDATIIQSDARLVITTNRNVAKVSKDYMLLHEKTVTVQETRIIHDFVIDSCRILNPVGKILIAETIISIGQDLTIICENRIDYMDNKVSIDGLLFNLGGISVKNDPEIERILKPIILNRIDSEFKPQIHEFYTDGKRKE